LEVCISPTGSQRDPTSSIRHQDRHRRCSPLKTPVVRTSPYLHLILPLILASCAVTPQEPARIPQPGDADFPAEARSDRHSEKVALVRSGDFDLAMIGDSIVHTVGDMPGEPYGSLREVWDRHFAPRKAINLGYSGFRTENILWNLENGELDFRRSPKVAVLLIGTNNTDDRHYKTVHSPGQILEGTRAIVELIRKRHPKTKVLILRILPRGDDRQEGAKGYRWHVFHGSDACVRTAREAGLLTRQLADGRNVFWMDLNPVFLRPDGTINTDLMPDLLHPNQAGAEAWAQAIEPMLTRLMGSPR
jgi:lysophospholipase L1-like esterase